MKVDKLGFRLKTLTPGTRVTENVLRFENIRKSRIAISPDMVGNKDSTTLDDTWDTSGVIGVKARTHFQAIARAIVIRVTIQWI